MDTEKKLFSEFPPVSTGAWEAQIKKDLSGDNYKNKLKWQTGEGIEALPFYRREDLEDLSTSAPLVTSNDWEIRQPIHEQNPAKANKIVHQALKNGANAPEFLLEVRSTEGMLGGDLRGTAIQNQEAFHHLMKGIDLTAVPIHFDSGLASSVVLAMLHNEIEAQQIDHSSVSGTILFDPYAFIISNGQISTDEPAFRDKVLRMTAFCERHLPRLKCLGIDARIYHNAGGTIVQELGYALATGSEYMAALSETGLDTDAIASAIHFNFPVGSNYFLEIAKFRAARKLWQKILDAYEVENPKQAYLHGTSSAWNKSIYDPYVNMLRTTTEGMSAAIAGCDAITLQPFDTTFRPPDEFSRRIARNSQIILKEESYFNKAADPAAGSYYIEILTDKMAKAAWACFREVEQQGGLLKSIRGGYVQAAIEESRKERDRAIATRKRIFVGTNQYPNKNDKPARERKKQQPTVSLQETDRNPALDRSHLISSLKKALNQGSALGDLVPAVTEQKKYDIRPIQPYRGPQPFEALRQATENNPTTPEVLTLPFGNRNIRKARSSFTVNLFGCIGYRITDPIGFESVEEAVSKIKEKEPDIVVLCSSDEAYKELVPALCKKMDELDAQPITVLAGYPKEQIQEYREAGIDVFIHAKGNTLETLKEFQKRLNIIKNEGEK